MLTMSTLVAMATEEVVFYTHSSSNSKLLTNFISYIYYLLGREGGREGETGKSVPFIMRVDVDLPLQPSRGQV